MEEDRSILDEIVQKLKDDAEFTDHFLNENEYQKSINYIQNFNEP